MKLKPIANLGIDKGQYTKSVGYVLTTTGSKRAKTFYLGSDANAALVAAAIRRRRWQALKDSGAAVWPSEVLAELEAADETSNAPEVAPVAVIAKPKPSALTVGEVAARYIAHTKLRQESGRCSVAHLVSLTQRVEYAVSILGKAKPMDSIDAAELTRTVLKISARPTTKRKGKDGKFGRMSVETARNVLKWLKYCLEWADENELWTRPRRFAKIFSENKPNSTPVELLAAKNGEAEAKRFELDELAKLYAVANDTQRLWILLGLNCGFAAEELNSLDAAELKGLNTESPYIERIRGKTLRVGEGVYAKWGYLFPETVYYLRKYLAANPIGPDGRVLRSGANGPLVYFRDDKARQDAVYVAWQWLYKKIGKDNAPRYLSPKYLRKTSAWLMRKRYGRELADMLLSHADNGMISRYSARDWDKLTEALKGLRNDLQPMFDAAEAFVRRPKGKPGPKPKGDKKAA